LIAPLRDSTGKRAYQPLKHYAKSHGLHVLDSLITATAMEEGLALVTKNRKHFSAIKGLRLEIPGYYTGRHKFLRIARSGALCAPGL